jgi:hypothetical protein
MGIGFGRAEMGGYEMGGYEMGRYEPGRHERGAALVPAASFNVQQRC